MKRLVFERYELAHPTARFFYRYSGGALVKEVGLAQIPAERFAAADAEVLDSILAHIGISFARYFYPIEDFDVIEVEPIRLPDDAVAALERSFVHQLAELRYRSGLDPNKPVRVVCSPDGRRHRPPTVSAADEAVLLCGGGKDSAVAAEILNAISLPFTWLTVQSPIARSMRGVIDRSGNRRHVHLEHRGFDRQIRRRARRRDVLAPRLAFLSLLTAYLEGCRYIVMANEHSANFGNLTVDGLEINHQYGKSLDAGRRFDAYVERHVVGGIRFFSLLSPLYELQVASLFSRYPRYFDAFLSCNVGQRRDRWCARCAKCAFIFLILSAVLEPERVRQIFGAELFESQAIRDWIVELTQGDKPFECVGTREESKLALWLALERNPEAGGPGPGRILLESCCADIDPEAARREILAIHDRPHDIPAELYPAVKRYLDRRLAG